MTTLAQRFHRVFALLRRTQPLPDPTDVVWAGPYFIPRRRIWCPTRFLLYRGTLYASVQVSSTTYDASWTMRARRVAFEHRFTTGEYINDEPFWSWVLEQVERRLTFALADLARYNRMVERRLPLSSRTGHIERRLSWPADAKPPLSPSGRRSLDRLLDQSAERPHLEAMTSAQYFATAAIAYDAGFRELRPLSPVDKYRRKADGRHGGLLDLPPANAPAFARWFHGRTWTGTHPWEIVFGHPHGIMISPRFHDDTHDWSYYFWVSATGWYATAARMARALARREVPFEFVRRREVLDALEGIDEVDVGPGHTDVRVDDVQRERPNAVTTIRWDAVPQMTVIEPDQIVRITAEASRAPIGD